MRTIFTIFLFCLLQSISFSQDCKPELNKFVYNPNKYITYVDCKTVSGTVELVTFDYYGSAIIRLRLDPTEDEDLINEYSKKKLNGCLAVTIICINDAEDKEAHQLCKKCKYNMKIPNKNDHIKVTGRICLNRVTGYIEIIPVSNIETIK
jgi:hypothetical protein